MLTKYLHRFLWFYMSVMLFVNAYIYGFVLKANGDNVEHLHTSWMVWMGRVPYKDFFQHHNPLTWYLSAPLTSLFIDDFSIYAIFNVISMVMLYGIALYQAKILLLDNGNKSAAILLAAIFISGYSLLWSTDYRPDTFMFLFYYMGLYYLFLYIKNNQCKTLVISFICFFISFMFTQKVMMHLIIPGLALIYWVCCGKIKISHLLYASIAPAVMLGIFLIYLYANDALAIYWKSNYLYNTYIPKIFQEQRIVVPPREYIDVYVFWPIGTIATFYLLIKGNTIEKIFSLMFVVEAFFRIFYFSAFLHYIIFWLMTAMLLTVMFLCKPIKYRVPIVWADIIFVLIVLKYEYALSYTSPVVLVVAGILILTIFVTYKIKTETFLAVLGLFYVLFMAYYSYQMTYKTNIAKKNIVNGHEVAFQYLTPCDYALNGYYTTYNFKAKDPGYYSILLGQIDVLGEKVGVAKRDNLNDLIRKYKPKIISAGIFWDTYWEQRGKRIPAHKIDPYLINTYYEPLNVGDMFILKPQYQHHSCVYNGKEWKFMD